jgi:hypothetical protein
MNQIIIDNRRPDDDTYPTTEPADFRPQSSDRSYVDFHREDYLIVKEGDYVVDSDGDIMIATTTNDPDRWANDYLRASNVPYFRAKYLGCKDDLMAFANQCRLATAAEISQAKAYVRKDPMVTTGGQLVLL